MTPIEATFLHLPNFGRKTELALWAKNILSWKDYLALEQSGNLFFDQSTSILNDSFSALKTKDVNFFAKQLPRSQYFRLALSFPEDVIFLDIETTGLSRFYDHITMIGWSIGSTYGYYINGVSEDNELINSISMAKVLVTFNGSIFDVPFIKDKFSNIKIPKCHIDLRFFAKSVKLDGGQKKIEEFIGIKRHKDIKNSDGFQATILWDQYKWGDKKSLLKLIQYNHADIEGMKAILDYCIEYKYKQDGYIRYFSAPTKFKKYKSSIDKAECRKFVFNSSIPFDPKSTLKYKELASRINGKIKIIGIDLTGSEMKASGVAILEANKVETTLIGSDDELIDFVVNKKPMLVSIDSPLSLPLGRISVFDDDPGRNEFGIMRQCERILKKRGVNAYPTLLPSMQKLTKRGIEIAYRLRKLGIPVIESYPGVIQDIIGLPRKQASLLLLKKGLGIFGLKGSFLKEDVSHDEVDAITSAIVGLFFLSGDYEAIGDFRENFMIIPNLSAKYKKKLVIGLSGQIAAGKTTVSRFIENKFGFKYTRYSEILKNILQERGEITSRANLQKLGYEISQRQTELSKLLYSNVKDSNFIIVDGLRYPEDYAFFFEMFGYDFKLIYIEAPKKDKKTRYMNDGSTAEDYNLAITNDTEKNVIKLKSLATVVINNNKDIASINQKVADFVTKWGV